MKKWVLYKGNMINLDQTFSIEMDDPLSIKMCSIIFNESITPSHVAPVHLSFSNKPDRNKAFYAICDHIKSEKEPVLILEKII